jgi:hypothetical protein
MDTSNIATVKAADNDLEPVAGSAAEALAQACLEVAGGNPVQAIKWARRMPGKAAQSEVIGIISMRAENAWRRELRR